MILRRSMCALLLVFVSLVSVGCSSQGPGTASPEESQNAAKASMDLDKQWQDQQKAEAKK